MKTFFLWKRFLIVCLMLALLTGCETVVIEIPTPEPTVIPISMSTDTPESTVTPLPFVEGTEFPTGRFVHEDANRAFEFDEDGTWRYFEGNMEVPAVSGKYATNGNLYTEMTHDYLGSKSIPVTYFWAYDGKNLTFQLYGEDMLSHRRSCYDGQTYTKSE